MRVTIRAKCQRFGEAAGFDDDGIEPQSWFRECCEGVFERGVVIKTADASTRDGEGFIDLPDDEARVDVEVSEIVDDDPDARVGVAQQMVEEAGFPRPQVTGQEDHRNSTCGLIPIHMSSASVAWPPRHPLMVTFFIKYQDTSTYAHMLIGPTALHRLHRRRHKDMTVEEPKRTRSTAQKAVISSALDNEKRFVSAQQLHQDT